MSGDFDLRETVEMLQSDNVSLVVSQRIDRSSNLPCLPKFLGTRREHNQRRVIDIGVAQWHRCTPPLGALDIDRCSPGNGRQPRRRISICVERCRTTPGLQKGLLACVLGQRSIAQNAVRDGINEPTVAVVHCLDRVWVTGAKPRNNLGMNHGGCHLETSLAVQIADYGDGGNDKLPRHLARELRKGGHDGARTRDLYRVMVAL